MRELEGVLGVIAQADLETVQHKYGFEHLEHVSVIIDDKYLRFDL